MSNDRSGEAVPKAQAAALPNIKPCKRCDGKGFVDDGEITHSAGGIPYENGPVKCIKDCPDCTGRNVFATQPAPQGVPDGWKLVPETISEEMHIAASKVLRRCNGLDGTPQRMTDAMLAAAPAAPRAKPQQPEGLREALQQIADWRLPATGEFWDNDHSRPIGYEVQYGANGARDYMRCVARAALAATAQPKESREALAKRLIGDVIAAAEIATTVCRAVAELPDRNSPEDWPEAMLVTHDELHQIVEEAVIKSQPVAPAQGHDWWRKRADEIELEVAKTGSREAMACYTQMRGLIQAVAAATTQVDAIPGKPITRFNPLPGLGMNPAPNGLYVYYRDYLAALAAQGGQEAEPVAGASAGAVGTLEVSVSGCTFWPDERAVLALSVGEHQLYTHPHQLLQKAGAALGLLPGMSFEAYLLPAIEKLVQASKQPAQHAERTGLAAPLRLVVKKLERFDECAEDSDSGGCDIGRPWFDTLTHLGLLERTQRSPAEWTMTPVGHDLLRTGGFTHPPRTQGDARYRLLESGDVIQAEDEIVADDGVNWVRPTPLFTGMPYSSVFKTARRRIDAAIARQSGKDGG